MPRAVCEIRKAWSIGRVYAQLDCWADRRAADIPPGGASTCGAGTLGRVTLSLEQTEGTGAA